MTQYKKNILFYIFVLLLIVVHWKLINFDIDHPVQTDEMFHILAAKSYNENGQYKILDGKYERAKLYTRVVAFKIQKADNELISARRISQISSVALILLTVLFISVIISKPVGALTGTFLSTCPIIVNMATVVRFYSLHSFLFVLCSFTIYILLYRWKRLKNMTRYIALLFIGITFMLSYHLQVLTLIGILGICIGIVVCYFVKLARIYSLKNKYILYLLLALVIVSFISFLIFDDYVVSRLTSEAPWAKSTRDLSLYYHSFLDTWYPAIWPIAPFLFALGMMKWFDQNTYCISIFITAIIILSIGEQKSYRYMMFALPFMFAAISSGIYVIYDIIIKYIHTSNTA